MLPDSEPGANCTCQSRFHARWSTLRDPHVRTLAWLLDAPDMLDITDPRWKGRIATLGAVGPEVAHWLHALDQNPSALHDALNVQRFTRLGRYAEQLLAFYFRHQETLLAQGQQVREGSTTIGEFDFLLHQADGLAHWELATKVYLLQCATDNAQVQADYFVGPNLADTLGAKMGKIIDRQLALSTHPAARAVLPVPVVQVGAVIKGWLFYPQRARLPVQGLGLSPGHCHGFWVELDRFQPEPGLRYLPLQRLEWLTPIALAHNETGQTHAADSIGACLAEAFAGQSMPVMIAVLAREGDAWCEQARGFVVPPDWATRAGRRTASFSPLP